MVSKSKKKEKLVEAISASSSSFSSPSSSDDSDHTSKRHHRHQKERSRSEKEKKREKDEKKRKKRERRERHRERDRKERKLRKERKKRRRRDYDSRSEDADGSGPSGSEGEDRLQVDPEIVMRDMLKEFPSVGNDLKQLLKMIDDGQAVDIKGISEKLLVKHLKKLFSSLNLTETGDRVFLLPPKSRATLEVIGHLIQTNAETEDQQAVDADSVPEDLTGGQSVADSKIGPLPKDDSCPPRKRVIGPEMPSEELLAAAAKLTEAQSELRDAEVEEDSEIFIGPAPPAAIAEAESANEAERFEEVTRIMAGEANDPYDILGVNHKMSADNIKKRYWKISLLVHPDKCSHPQAHQAFIKLNKSFKELQDPEKRKALDEQIKRKEEQEEMKAELKRMREAALWRKSQGISMEGDDVLLADMDIKEAPTRDEWMTTLPPERKPGGVTMQSTKFSKGTKEGRGDTSAWTDTPSDRAQKAKMNYLNAYNETAALASNEEEKKRSSADADLVDKYNKTKRSKSLVQKYQEEKASLLKKKSKQLPEEKEDWVGKHPWKPWDREKDLTAGRKSINLDSESMAKGLTSRFSSGTFQRNFL